MRSVSVQTLACILLVGCPSGTGNGEPTTEAIPWRFPGAPQIVAIGDVHGDIGATRRALRLAGAIDDHDQWIGGELVVVQTGDQLDRGDGKQKILDLFERLVVEAREAGGAFHPLNGNHEIMNAKLDLRYVTEGGFEDFRDAVSIDEIDETLANYDEAKRARVEAFRPGGKYARMLATRNTVIVVGDSVFVHGGVLPEHVDYDLGRLNAECQAWLAGSAPIPEWVEQKNNPIWMRHYSDEVDSEDCALLSDVLEQLDAERMSVGHTVQDAGITSHCDGKVWCIDVGMAAHYGGEVAVLEMRGDQIKLLTERH